MAGAKIRDWTLWGGKRFLLPKVIPESPAGGGGGGTRSAKERNKRSMYPPHVLTLTCKAYVRGVKSFVDDLNEPGIVRCGVALLPRPAEIKPAIHRFISHFLFFFFFLLYPKKDKIFRDIGEQSVFLTCLAGPDWCSFRCFWRLGPISKDKKVREN
jgi:hypothetical protein